MFQRLPVAVAQVKAGNNSKSLLNEIRHIFLFFVPVKTNHKKRIQQHSRIYSVKIQVAYKKWTLYLWIRKTVSLMFWN